ncbi:MAG: 2-amino-4-hydroxy-6-hydroxymethyldihydropteridine diphosphokinase [Cyanobacteria bacterium M_surface_7_m2_037]|nr:2-amino-4-hydroxy-6-hydroxymethyldihydropteridine diphosphokinase [Cyanobacteria bacterium M_surface_10_m1_298]MBM5795262.1 2-amino-4-hydroxy-6-hydroxymethyldihydropteridine diphosphokinase [Cyanobacteria bacterium M_surface_7_m2_037]
MRTHLPEGEALAIGLGANLASALGGPLETLVAVRPRLEQVLSCWAGRTSPLRWSPLFRTAPVGGPPGQPDYLNAVLVAQVARPPRVPDALQLLARLQQLELAFGRQRLEHWGPRTLDLDLLWWGELRCDQSGLELPHPRWHQRAFVLAPLLAIDRDGGAPLPVLRRCVGADNLLAQELDSSVQLVTPSPIGWP